MKMWQWRLAVAWVVAFFVAVIGTLISMAAFGPFHDVTAVFFVSTLSLICAYCIAGLGAMIWSLRPGRS